MQTETATDGLKRPLGSRRSTPSFRRSQDHAKAFHGLPDGVGRYDLLRLVKEVGRDMGFTPRLCDHLEYLINHTQDQDWQTPGEHPIVYAGVETMAFDFGVDPKTIWNREQALHELGALTWRDKGNHGRTGQRDRKTGRIIFAFGVDLSPLGQLYETLAKRAEAKAFEKEAWKQERRRVSSLRRQVRAYLAEAFEDPRVASQALALQAVLEELNEDSSRNRTLMHMQRKSAGLQVLLDELEQLLDGVVEDSDASALAQEEPSICEYDVNNSGQEGENSRPNYITTHPSSDKSDTSNPTGDKLRHRPNGRQNAGSLRPDGRTGKPTGLQGKAVRNSKPNQTSKQRESGTAESGIEHLTLEAVVSIASDDFQSLLPQNRRAIGWPDMVEAAYQLCPLLGINRHAWAEAAAVMGRNAAAVCVLLADLGSRRAENPVTNPGGYLRGMTRAAEAGQLHLHRSVFGLLRTLD